MQDSDLILLHTLPDEVEARTDVFGPSMVLGIFGQGLGAGIVDM
jgi:hypothetical protein